MGSMVQENEGGEGKSEEGLEDLLLREARMPREGKGGGDERVEEEGKVREKRGKRGRGKRVSNGTKCARERS